MTSVTERTGTPGVMAFLGRRSGRGKADLSDYLTYGYLLLATVVMFGPVIWLVLSSFKSSGEVVRFPPRILPYQQEMVELEGFDEPLPLFEATLEDGTVRQLAQVRRVGLEATMIDPAAPDETYQVPIDNRVPVESVAFRLDNYQEGVQSFKFATYFRNSVIVTVVATALTLAVNSMCAFGLSKYRFVGRDFMFLVIVSALMVPISVILVPIFFVINEVGWYNTLWALIIPGAATPTGIFLLRQYMLTIPDELLDAARIDGASEWYIFLKIILPLSRPALAVLTIFSIMWRWNDFVWPKIALQDSDLFTLQVGLQSFQGELTVQWHLILAMTVLTLLPITFVFALLQKYIATGIATAGMK